MNREHTLTSKSIKTEKSDSKTKTLTKKPASKTKHDLERVVGRVHPNSEHWRCPECTFMNDPTSTVCNTCKAERKVDQNFIAKKRLNKPSKTVKNRKSEEAKQLQSHDTYYDRTDKSENVPIADIKKYHYDPSRLPRNVPALSHDRVRSPKSSNIHTISDLVPSSNPAKSSISRPEELKQSSVKRGKQGMKDLIGMLQAADSGESMPCMRKLNKK